MKLVIAMVALLVASCTSITIKPLPRGARTCRSDWDCPPTHGCWFPGVDTQPQCIPGKRAQTIIQY